MLPRSALSRVVARQIASRTRTFARPTVLPALAQMVGPSRGRWYSPAPGEAKASVEDAVEQAAKEASKETEETLALLKAKDAEIVDLMSRLRYAQADFQNLQRISQIERQKASTYAVSSLAKSLLTTLDNLSMALNAIPENLLTSTPPPSSSQPPPPSSSSQKKTDPEFFTPSSHTSLRQLHEGVQLTRSSLLSALKSHGVEPFDAKGEPFDPNFHEAVFEVPVNEEMEGKVVEVMKGGYKIGERVLRAAQVGVGRKQ